jgi:hypothetical protein
VSTIDDALIARAAAYGNLTALIGTSPMRLYAVDAATQNAARPYVTYQLITDPREHAMGSDPGMVRARFQLSCWGDASTDCRTVADQLRACYSRFRGTLLGVEILDVFVQGDPDLGRDPATRLYHRPVDLLVWHRE